MSQERMGMPSPELRQKLRDVFGVKKPKVVKNPVMLPIHDEAPKDKPRTVGNVMLSAAAQQIYSPMQQAIPIKPSTQAQAGQGTAPAMDTQGPWGKPTKE